MAAFFARVGNGSQFHKTASTLKSWRISTTPNHKIFCRWNGEVSARNYVTEAVTKTSSCVSGRFPGISCHKSVRYGRGFLAIQGGRCLSVWPWSSGSISSANSTESELLQEGQTTTTTTEMANPFLQENMPETMLDSEMLKDMADAVTSLGEPTLASLGLGGFSPPGLIQQALELIHVSGNISWFASIATLTFILRVVCLPFIIKAQANTAKMNNIRPQLEEIQAQLRELANTYDAAAKATANLRLKQLYKDNGCHPFKSFLLPLVQMPLYISFFFALRKMSHLPVEAFKSGGHLWFQDLTVFDPYFILPVICSFSMLATVELGGEMGVSHPTMKTMKTIMRILAVAMIPLTAQFPAALFGFWVTSNMFTVGQVALLKHPAIRNAMGIPEMVAYTSDQDRGSFFENLKAGFKSSQEVAHIRHAEKMKHQRQKAMGEAPLEPTYEFNPRIRENMEMFRTDQLDEPGMPEQSTAKDPNFKPRRVKFNQDIFSGMMHRQAQKQRQKQRDKLRNKPGATM